ncbi:hypothetical protein GCM10022220_18300 [Actinocatenispora rupis]|uniref:tetratricopeptide repeat protein n=1 Tax=Actinocatenispora rupis TaxID=519421 RepID=UPI0031E7F144
MFGSLLIAEGDADAARQRFERATGAESQFAAQLLRNEFTAARELFRAVRDGAAFAAASRLAVDIARCRQRAGDTDAAAAVLALAADLGHPDSRGTAGLLLGTLRRDTGDLDGALAAWEAVPADAGAPAEQAAFRAGCLRHDRGGPNLDLAERWYRRVADGAGPLASHARYQLRRVLADLGRYEEADEVPLDGDVAAAAWAAADAIAASGAAGCLEFAYADAARGNDPAVAGPAALSLGTVLAGHGAAVAAYRRAVAVGGARIRCAAWNNIGERHADRGDLAAAREAYQRAIDDGPADCAARAAYNLGIRLQDAGLAEQAQLAYALAETFGDPEVTAHARRRAGTESPTERGFRLATEGDRAGAEASLTEAYGSAAVAGFALAAHARQLGAAHVLLAGLDDDGYRGAALVGGELAVAASRDGAHRVARDLLELVADVGGDRTPPAVRIELAGVLCELGENDEARRQYERAAAGADPVTVAVASHNLGLALRDAGDPDGAADAFRRAVEAGEGEASARAGLALADLLADRGDTDGADAVLTRVAATGPAELRDDAAFALIQLHARCGDLDRVAELAERAAAGRQRAAVAGFDTLGQQAAGQGDLAAAAGWFERAAAAGDPEWSPISLAHLGLVREQQGDHATARRLYEQAVASGVDETETRAASRLGQLLYQRGELADAAYAWARVADSAVPDADGARDNVLVAVERLAGAGDHAGAASALHRLAGTRHRTTAVSYAQRLAEETAADRAATVPYLRCVVEYGDVVDAAWAGLDLGDALAATGDTTAATAAYARVGVSRVRKPAGVADYRRWELVSAVDRDAGRALLAEMAWHAGAPVRRPRRRPDRRHAA